MCQIIGGDLKIENQIKNIEHGFIKVLDRINRIDRIIACRPEAGQAINHRLRRVRRYGGERRYTDR